MTEKAHAPTDADWYDTHCPTCDAPEPWHTATCAVVHVKVPEPSAERGLTPCGNLVCTGCRLCGCLALGIEPQGEPSDAQALLTIRDDIVRNGGRADAAVLAGLEALALRAAGGVR